MGLSETKGYLNYFGVLIIRILLFGVLYWGPLFSETPIWAVLYFKVLFYKGAVLFGGSKKRP